MIPVPKGDIRIFLKPGKTDMRKSINGLSIMVQETLKIDPFTDSLFAFCNRGRNIIKLLYWDRNGLCLWHKRLERDRFPWPESSEVALQLTPEQLQWLLNGIDFRKAHKNLSYSHIA